MGRGYRQSTAAGGAPTRPKFPQGQFYHLNKVSAALAEHTFLFFVSSTLLGLTGPRRTGGIRDSPFRPHVRGYAPANLLNFLQKKFPLEV